VDSSGDNDQDRETMSDDQLTTLARVVVIGVVAAIAAVGVGIAVGIERWWRRRRRKRHTRLARKE
jgi:ABC-type nitrate/sulfonate/bicarbonate transport system permease component